MSDVPPAWVSLFFELTNEATAIAETAGDRWLMTLAAMATLGAGERLGLSDEQVSRMRNDLRKCLDTAAKGPRLSVGFRNARSRTAVAPTTSARSRGRKKVMAAEPERGPEARRPDRTTDRRWHQATRRALP